MGCKHTKIKPVNKECPICYEVHSNNFILLCGHSFDYICLQKICFDYFLEKKTVSCPLCRENINKKTLKSIFKTLYVPHIYPNDFVNYNTLNLKHKIKINKYETIKVQENLTYMIPCYKLEDINIQHFFHLDNVNFIYESFNNEISNIYKLKLTCLLNRNNNDWYKFIKNNNLYKILNTCTNINDDPTNSISVYIHNPNILITYNEKYGTVEKGFKFYDQMATILIRTFIVNYNESIYFINELYSICYKN
jgi:hypothetical protein